MVIAGIIGIVIGIEINRANINRAAKSLYELEEAVGEWEADLDPENPTTEEILPRVSEYTFQKGSYAENRRLHLLGEIHELAGEDNTAAEYFFQVAESARGYLATIALLKAALLYEQAGDITTAQELFLKFVNEYDYQEEPRVLFTLGRIAESNEEYETAHTFYTQIIDDHSSSDWTNLAFNRIIELKTTDRIID